MTEAKEYYEPTQPGSFHKASEVLSLSLDFLNKMSLKDHRSGYKLEFLC